MLELAKRCAERYGQNIDWHKGDVTELPFDNEEFDLLVCCQGLPFFPDKAVALREMRRALKPDGRLIASVWLDVGFCPSHNALAKALADLNGADPAPMPPFSLANALTQLPHFVIRNAQPSYRLFHGMKPYGVGQPVQIGCEFLVGHKSSHRHLMNNLWGVSVSSDSRTLPSLCHPGRYHKALQCKLRPGGGQHRTVTNHGPFFKLMRELLRPNGERNRELQKTSVAFKPVLGVELMQELGLS